MATSKPGDTRKAFAALKAHRKSGAPTDMRQGLRADPKRFAAFSARSDDLLLDYSKCAVNARTMKLLRGPCRGGGRRGQARRMFEGAVINTTEGRAVLHTALRNRANTPVLVDGRDVMPEVTACSMPWRAFAGEVRGSGITDVVNIGIGGSDLGPAMTTLALAPYHDGPRLHYVSNVDGAHIADTLKGLDAGDDAVPHRVQDLHHHRDHDQCADGAEMDRGEAGRGRGCRPFRGDLHRHPQGQGLRHPRGPHLRLLGLGGRALLDLVGDRPAADDRHRAGEFPPVPRRRRTPWTGISAKRRSCENLPMLMGADRRLAPQCLQLSLARHHSLRPAPVALSRLSAAARHGIERQARDQVRCCR